MTENAGDCCQCLTLVMQGQLMEVYDDSRDARNSYWVRDWKNLMRLVLLTNGLPMIIAEFFVGLLMQVYYDKGSAVVWRPAGVRHLESHSSDVHSCDRPGLQVLL